MNGHTTRFPIAMSFAAMLALSTVLGAGAQQAPSAPDTLTAAAADHAQAAMSREVPSDAGENLVQNRPSQARVEIGSPSRFNKTIDYGE